jgi:predicted transcriptional regulator
MAQNGFIDLAPERITVGDVLAALDREGKLIYLLPDDSLQRAADTFREYGISQLPVLENGQMIGAVQEITIVYAQHRGVDSRKVRLRDVMARHSWTPEYFWRKSTAYCCPEIPRWQLCTMDT